MVQTSVDLDQFTVEQAMYMAGVDRDDDPWTRDCKFAAWLRAVNGCVVNSATDPVPDGTQVIVIRKGNLNVTES